MISGIGKLRKAERKQARLRLALTGVSGSGKTMGAINIARGLGGRFAIIDTERKSADLYSHLTDFDIFDIEKPFTTEKYIEGLRACEEAGMDIIIIDSLSHVWAGEGGILDIQEKITKASPSKNSYAAWSEVTPLHNKLVNAILQSQAHIIVTLRSKTHYEVINSNGKMKPVKLGLAPIQREGLDYEFTTVLELDKDSKFYRSSKDRTGLFENQNELITIETGEKLLKWLNQGKPLSEVEKEEVNRIKNILINADIDTLRSEFKNAREKYPQHENEFLKIAKSRKGQIETSELH